MSEIKFNDLVADVLLYIATYLNDRQNIYLFSVNKKMYKIRENVTFTNNYKLSQIKYSSFFNNFESVEVDSILDDNTILPKKIQKLKYYTKLSGHGIKTCISNLPHSIRVLNIQSEYSNDDIKVNIPPNVEKLKIGFMVTIMNKIPNTLKDLKIRYYTEITRNCIPITVESLYLDISHYGTFKCDNIPAHIKSLKFGNVFNCDLEGRFGANISSLSFGHFFNRSLDGHLPEKLKYLYLCMLFRHKLNQIPDSVLYIRLGKYSNRLAVPDEIKECNLKGYDKYWYTYYDTLGRILRDRHYIYFYKRDYLQSKMCDAKFKHNFDKHNFLFDDGFYL